MFADRIKTLRTERGYTMQELGKLVGVKKTTVSNWESGVNYPNTDTLLELAKIFAISTDELLGVTPGKIVNIANIRLDPDSQSSIDRINRMRAAGISEERIDQLIDLAISLRTE